MFLARVSIMLLLVVYMTMAAVRIPSTKLVMMVDNIWLPKLPSTLLALANPVLLHKILTKLAGLDMKFKVRMSSVKQAMLVEITFLQGSPSIRQVMVSLILLQKKGMTQEVNWVQEITMLCQILLYQGLLYLVMFYYQGLLYLVMFYHQGLLYLVMFYYQGLLYLVMFYH